LTELKNKFIYQLVVSATQLLVPLLTYPYITRVLGPANLGKINYIDFLAQAFTIFAAFGIPYYAVREISMLRNDNTKRSVVVTEMALLNLVFSLVATAGFILFTYPAWHQYPSLYLLAIANILLSAFSFEWYLQGTEAFRFSAIRTVVVRVAMIAAFYLLVKKEADYTIYYAIFTAAVFVLAFINSYKLLQENSITFKALHLKKHLKPLWHFFLTSSAISIYIYFDTIILQHLTNDEQAVGYYTITLKLVKIFLLVILAIGTVLTPRLSYLASTGKTVEINRQLNKFLQFIIISAIPVGAGIMILAPEIIETIAGAKFSPAIPLIRIQAFLPLVIGLSNLFCFQTLLPFNMEKKFLVIVIIGCIVSISMNFLLIPYLSAAGAAIANMITETIILILSGMYASKLVRFDFRPAAGVMLQSTGTSLIFIPVIFLCRYFFASPVTVLVTAVPACVVVYIIFQIGVFNNAVISETKDFLLRFGKHK
jgi:O-antigen/teichoic acid export membrane protein